MIVIEDVQLTPKRVPVGGNYLLRVRARDNADVSYADTEMLEMAIGMVDQYNPSDYSNFGAVATARDAGQALLASNPTIDRQAEVDEAAQAIFDAIGALEWAEGHRNNPIPYRHLMSVTEGLYYSYNGHIYRCLQSASSSMMIPGTAPRLFGRRLHDLQPSSSGPYLYRGCNHISDIDHVDLGRGLIYYLKFKERSTC